MAPPGPRRITFGTKPLYRARKLQNKIKYSIIRYPNGCQMFWLINCSPFFSVHYGYGTEGALVLDLAWHWLWPLDSCFFFKEKRKKKLHYNKNTLWYRYYIFTCFWPRRTVCWSKTRWSPLPGRCWTCAGTPWQDQTSQERTPDKEKQNINKAIFRACDCDVILNTLTVW